MCRAGPWGGLDREILADGKLVFALPTTTSCLADPDVRNVASIRAFEKAGFRVVDEIVDPEDGERHAVVRRDRAAI